jgi:hypothetical protein
MAGDPHESTRALNVAGLPARISVNPGVERSQVSKTLSPTDVEEVDGVCQDGRQDGCSPAPAA